MIQMKTISSGDLRAHGISKEPFFKKRTHCSSSVGETGDNLYTYFSFRDIWRHSIAYVQRDLLLKTGVRFVRDMRKLEKRSFSKKLEVDQPLPQCPSPNSAPHTLLQITGCISETCQFYIS